MGNTRSPVEAPRRDAPVPGYRRLAGAVPVFHPPRLAAEARGVRDLLSRGSGVLSGVLDVGPPALWAALVGDEDRSEAPRESPRPYPPGLPYFTRATDPPTLVLPARLSPVFRPRTGATYPLAVWHELAHAFLLREEVVRTPAWLGEFAAQAAAAAIAREAGLPLEEHLGRVDRNPGFTARGFRGPSSPEDQMKFQNLLLALGAAALEEYGSGFLGRLFRALWAEEDVVDEGRAGDLLAASLGAGGAAWLSTSTGF